jgi:hypothetical protein
LFCLITYEDFSDPISISPMPTDLLQLMLTYDLILHILFEPMKQPPWFSADPTEPMSDISAVEHLSVSHDVMLARMLDPEIDIDIEAELELEAH